jgi:hypothetical protein
MERFLPSDESRLVKMQQQQAAAKWNELGLKSVQVSVLESGLICEARGEKGCKAMST